MVLMYQIFHKMTCFNAFRAIEKLTKFEESTVLKRNKSFSVVI